MKKILKKLISVPNKFEAFLQRRKLPTLIFILAFCLFTLFNFWWYGVFDDFADVTYRSRAIDEERIDSYVQERVLELPYEERSEGVINYSKESYKKMASKVSTKALLEWVLMGCRWWDPCYQFPSEYYEYIKDERNKPYVGIILEELESRHNVSRTLARMYLKHPLFDVDSLSGALIPNLGELVQMECFLSQPELNRYLPFWNTVGSLRDRKQKQKFDIVDTKKWEYYLEHNYQGSPRAAETHYLYLAIINCLYPDACIEDCYREEYEYSDVWNYEKLYEHASEYIDLDARDMRAALGLTE